MNMYRLIPPSCIVSPTARRVYLFAAAFIPACFVAWLFAAFVDPGGPYGRLLDTVFEFVWLLVALAIAALLTGMECFLFMYDDSSAWKQMLWFLVNCLVPVGNIVYCCTVYRRKTPMTSEQVTRAMAASA